MKHYSLIMKRITLTSVLFLCYLFVNAQLVLTPQGFVSTNDTSKNYIVVSFDSVGQKALFDRALLYLNTIYVSPKDVLSLVDSTSITINGLSKGAIPRNNQHVFDLNYSINIQFKQGKIRVNAPAVKLTTTVYSNFQTLYIVANNSLDGRRLGIWNEKGKLVSERAKIELETFFNKYIDDMVKGINSNSTDW